MAFLETIMGALDSLWSKKVRTLLTMLGFAIGIAIVTIVLSVGSFSSQVIRLYYSGISECKYINVTATEKKNREVPVNFPKDLCYEFNSQLPDYIYGISFTSDTSHLASAKVGKVSCDTVLNGVSAVSEKINQVKMVGGRFISDEDCTKLMNTVVIPDELGKKLFGDAENSLGKEIVLKCDSGEIFTCAVTGIYKTFRSPGETVAYNLYLPYTFINDIFGVMNESEMPALKVAYKEGSFVGGNPVTDIYYFFSAKMPQADVAVYMDSSIDQGTEQMITLVTILFIFVSLIIFLVSGMGLTNTLMISVSERTPEIGIKKALGAPDKVIRSQFVMEAFIICFFACILGIALGAASNVLLKSNIEELLSMLLDEKYSYIIANADIPLKTSGSSSIYMMIASLIMGRIFGGYPAKKAMRMQPVDALRFE